MIHPNYKRKEIGAGELRTPVSFFLYGAGDSPEPGDIEEEKLFECTALVYNPSMKDMEILNSKGKKEGMTIKIRDPHQDYIPDTKHKVKIDDYRYGIKKVWEIVDVSYDFEHNEFVKIILGATS